jgi:hypothetical protein
VNLRPGQVEKEIFEADGNPEAHGFVAADDLLQGPEEIRGAFYEQSYQPVAAFDVTDSAQRTNWRKIGSGR